MDDATRRLRKNRIRGLIIQRFGGYEALGEEIGLTPQGVSEIVNERTARRTSRYALASALGVRVEDLWPPEEEEPGPTRAAG